MLSTPHTPQFLVLKCHNQTRRFEPPSPHKQWERNIFCLSHWLQFSVLLLRSFSATFVTAFFPPRRQTRPRFHLASPYCEPRTLKRRATYFCSLEHSALRRPAQAVYNDSPWALLSFLASTAIFAVLEGLTRPVDCLGFLMRPSIAKTFDLPQLDYEQPRFWTSDQVGFAPFRAAFYSLARRALPLLRSCKGHDRPALSWYPLLDRLARFPTQKLEKKACLHPRATSFLVCKEWGLLSKAD